MLFLPLSMTEPSGRRHFSQAALAATPVSSNLHGCHSCRRGRCGCGTAALTFRALHLSVLLFQSLGSAPFMSHNDTCPQHHRITYVFSVTQQPAPSVPSLLFNAHSPLHLDQSNQAVNLISQGVSQLRITSKLLRLSQPLVIE